ncbi:tetratricopeptide repeat protein [Adhaeretor mobilis]|uniref:Tetratricopeptide repeat protein n=1 Tax=Adhaeretor mobilis TaxID=1930276 RepID=A0A517N044_9BACT|nr:tetratricopeptide repeat protein [Adhaeretor mobilis]QDT00495.1 Tetratricopeptide repeat protein [Adhaeretor mobilis]
MAVASTSGCASLRKYRVVPESVAKCRKLSREGVAAMERGNCQQARTLLDRAVEISPTDIDARRQYAEVLWNENAKWEAAEQMEAAVRLDPHHGPTVVRSGEMLLDSGSPDRALERASQAIALDSTLAGAWALRGRVYRQLEKPNQALADMQLALRYGPHATDVLLDISELQYEMGRPHRALTTLHHVLDSYAVGEEPRRALWLEGLAYSSVERPVDAIASLRAANGRGEPNADLMFQIAKAEAAAGRPTDAAATVQQALAINGEHEPSRVFLAQLQAQMMGDVTLRR